MLIKCEYQDWSADFAYAPPLKTCIINTDDIRSVDECDSRGFGPWVRITFKNGKSRIVQGTVDMFNCQTTPQKTDRGFQIVTWTDHNGFPCELQQSSAIDNTERGLEQPGSSFVWLGRPKLRMHMDRQQVEVLIAQLKSWLDHGTFEQQ